MPGGPHDLVYARLLLFHLPGPPQDRLVTVAVSVADPTSGVKTTGPLKPSELPVSAPGVKVASVLASTMRPSDTVAWVRSKPWSSGPRS